MSDTRRTRDDGWLANMLAEQLDAAVNDSPSAGRHLVRVSDAQTGRQVVGDSSIAIDASDILVDDTDAFVARSFDYEAIEWLARCAASPCTPTSH